MSLLDRLFKQKNNLRESNTDNINIVPRYIGSSSNQRKYAAVKTPLDAMKSSVVYRGISILSDSVASTPITIYHKNKSGYWKEDTNNPLWYLLNKIPNNRQNIYEFLECIVTQMIIYGNCYILIERDENYDIKNLVIPYPKTVNYQEALNFYNINDSYNKIWGQYTPDQIIHIRHKGIGSYVGFPIFDFAGKTIGLANATDSEALSTLNTGGKFKGIISSESSLTGFGNAVDSQVDVIRDNMQAELESGKDIITLQSGAEFKPISQTLRDLQLIDLHTTTISDLARYFGISPAKLGISVGSNYQASLQDNLNFYLDSLNPILKKIEAALNAKLINATVAKKYKIEFDRSALSYYKEMLAVYEKMLNLGLVSVNDIRLLLNKEGVEGGDETTISTNLQYVSNPKVIAEPMVNDEEKIINTTETETENEPIKDNE